jgi:UDP-N-acetylglucosamine acyltransferase
VAAPRVHPSALVHPDATLEDDVDVGAGAIIGPAVGVGAGSVIGPRATLEKNVRLGPRCRVGTGSILGGDPQDLKYRGEETWVEVGEGTVIREYSTINRGTAQSGRTSLGRNCLVMTYVHLAHDCHVGDSVILSNSVGLAGHVSIEDHAIVGGMTGVHQFVRIGAYAFIGGMAKVTKDVPPYCKADGNPLQLFGLNTIGLQRHGFGRDAIERLKKAYRHFFRSDLNISQALERSGSLGDSPEVLAFVRFIERSQRGVLV